MFLQLVLNRARLNVFDHFNVKFARWVALWTNYAYKNPPRFDVLIERNLICNSDLDQGLRLASGPFGATNSLKLGF